ncbi:MAG: hypothetical protein FJ045_05755, partial [Crenarchaeota archaeon]|nr:hypothetical protein [Thermoproteota archaeon]
MTFQGQRFLIYGMIHVYLAVYNLLLLVGLVAALPFIWREVKPDRKSAGDWKERIAVYGRETVEHLQKQKNIWLHTVSIGEFLSITPLIDRL